MENKDYTPVLSALVSELLAETTNPQDLHALGIKWKAIVEPMLEHYAGDLYHASLQCFMDGGPLAPVLLGLTIGLEAGSRVIQNKELEKTCQ